MPSSELTHVCGSGLAAAGGVGVLGADMTSEVLAAGVLAAGVLGVAVLAAGAVPVGVLGVAVLAAGAVPVGRGGGVRIAASNRLNASLVSPARASAAPAN